jgi:hypothetical protein
MQRLLDLAGARNFGWLVGWVVGWLVGWLVPSCSLCADPSVACCRKGDTNTTLHYATHRNLP